MCVVWLGVCTVVLCPSKRSSWSKGVPLLVQERCKKVARYGALGRALSKLGLGLVLVAVLGEAEGERRGLAASCGLGSGPVLVLPSGVVPETTGIRLQICLEEGDLYDYDYSNGCLSSGKPLFDSEGQVQGRLEVRVGNDWVTVEGHESSFGGDGPLGGEMEASVACRQLGNELGYTLVSASKVGREDTDDGSGWRYMVTCAGTESSLVSCAYFENGGEGWHEYDVGVSCYFLVPGGDECEECVAGKFSDTTDVAGCIECAAGSYSSSAGATSCQLVSASEKRQT
jgi:hypothetical protein